MVRFQRSIAAFAASLLGKLLPSGNGFAFLTAPLQEPSQACVLQRRFSKHFHKGRHSAFSLNIFAIFSCFAYWEDAFIDRYNGRRKQKIRKLQYLIDGGVIIIKNDFQKDTGFWFWAIMFV